MSVVEATILGCGSSGGVPRVGGDWGACDPAEPKNARTRCSLLVRCAATQAALSGEDVTVILVDTSPDLRFQLLREYVRHIDGVLYTHDHADQTHGIDDLRGFALRARRRVPVYMDERTEETLGVRFSYCFRQKPGGAYPPILELKRLPPPGEALTVHGRGGDIAATPFDQDHGTMISKGFRFGPLAYSSDVVGLSDESFAVLDGVDTWIVDCLRYTPHQTHAHLDMTLDWIKRVKPRRAILTNLHIDLDYQILKRDLPDGVEPAYDGLSIAFDC